jgi:hypothetical protein
VVAPIRQWDRYGDVDRACIKVLNEIVTSAGADVVVSSSLRHGKTVAELQAMLDAQGFIGRVIDKTPSDISGATRGEEIAAWLAQHARHAPHAVEGFVIIDDHVDMGDLRNHLVLTESSRGLQPAHVPRAVALLTKSVGTP